MNSKQIENAAKAAMGLAAGSDYFLDMLEKDLSLPNIPVRVMNNKKNWTTLAKYNGWEMQQNMTTKHARIINSSNVRVAWGTVNGMEKAFDRMVKLSKKYDGNDLKSKSY